jgi:hypothetical protein
MAFGRASSMSSFDCLPSHLCLLCPLHAAFARRADKKSCRLEDIEDEEDEAKKKWKTLRTGGRKANAMTRRPSWSRQSPVVTLGAFRAVGTLVTRPFSHCR